MKIKSFQVTQIKGNSEHLPKEVQEDKEPLYVITVLDEDGILYQSNVLSEYSFLDLSNEDSSLDLHRIRNIKEK